MAKRKRHTEERKELIRQFKRTINAQEALLHEIRDLMDDDEEFFLELRDELREMLPLLEQHAASRIALLDQLHAKYKKHPT